jgi:hypothetical protein
MENQKSLYFTFLNPILSKCWVHIKKNFDLEPWLWGCKLLVLREVRKKNLKKIGCVFFFIFCFNSEALRIFFQELF